MVEQNLDALRGRRGALDARALVMVPGGGAEARVDALARRGLRGGFVQVHRDRAGSSSAGPPIASPRWSALSPASAGRARGPDERERAYSTRSSRRSRVTPSRASSTRRSAVATRARGAAARTVVRRRRFGTDAHRFRDADARRGAVRPVVEIA
jgi:hypothetical protein